EERRKSAHTELGCKAWAGVAVDGNDLQTTAVAASELDDDGSRDAAGCAPLRGHIDENGQGRVLHLCQEAELIDVDHVGIGDHCMLDFPPARNIAGQPVEPVSEGNVTDPVTNPGAREPAPPGGARASA